MSNLLPRQDVGGLKGYYDYSSKGKNYSVVDLGTTMSTAPFSKEVRDMIFLGWEAMEVDGGELKGEPIRAETWEELKKLL